MLQAEALLKFVFKNILRINKAFGINKLISTIIRTIRVNIKEMNLIRVPVRVIHTIATQHIHSFNQESLDSVKKKDS